MYYAIYRIVVLGSTQVNYPVVLPLCGALTIFIAMLFIDQHIPPNSKHKVGCCNSSCLAYAKKMGPPPKKKRRTMYIKKGEILRGEAASRELINLDIEELEKEFGEVLENPDSSEEMDTLQSGEGSSTVGEIVSKVLCGETVREDIEKVIVTDGEIAGVKYKATVTGAKVRTGKVDVTKVENSSKPVSVEVEATGVEVKSVNAGITGLKYGASATAEASVKAVTISAGLAQVTGVNVERTTSAEASAKAIDISVATIGITGLNKGASKKASAEGKLVDIRIGTVKVTGVDMKFAPSAVNN